MKKPPAKKLPVKPLIKAKQSITIEDVKKLFRELIHKEFARLGIYIEEGNNSVEPVQEIPNKEEIDDPMDIDIADIDLVRLENAKDLLPMEGRVEGSDVQILADTCANTSFIPKLLVDELEMDIDVSKIQKIIGVPGENRTLGTVRDVLIELAPGCVIKEDLAVLKDYPYREIGLSRACLRRYNYDVLESRGHIPLTCNEKNFFIPIVPDKNRSK